MYLAGAIFFFWLAWFINKRWGQAWYVTIPSALVGSLLLAVSTAGAWLGSVLHSVAGMAASLLGTIVGGDISASLILGLIALIGTIIIVADLVKDHNCNKKAIIAFTLTPLAALYAGGLVGETHEAVRQAASTLGTTAMSALIGGG